MRPSTSLRTTAGAVATALALGALALPAAADDDHEDDSSVEVAGLEVEVRPAIALPGADVVVVAEYDVDDDSGDDDNGDHDSGDDDDSDDDSGDGSSGSGSAGTPADAVPVAFTVDYGDGAPAVPLTLLGDDLDEAVGTHAYAAEGSYRVTVTAEASGGAPVVASVVVQVGGGAARLGGRDRFETANRLAREDFPADGRAGAVLLARSDGFADALAAAPVALLEDAPVLLTATADLPPSVRAEIVRALGPTGTVYVLGGEAAVSPGVMTDLAAAGYDVRRIAGDDRVETALELSRFLLDAGVEVDEVVLASAGGFPDALSGASYAAAAGAPVLLTAPGALDPRVRDLLLEMLAVEPGLEVRVVGGAAVVSDAVVTALQGLGLQVERASGSDRYETSARIAAELFPAAGTVVLATGSTFPDALAGAAAAGRRDAPVLLVGGTLSDAARDYLRSRAGEVQALYVLGGPNAVAPTVIAEARAELGL